MFTKREQPPYLNMKRLFDFDPFTGITQWFLSDEENNTSTIYSEQDIEPELEAAQALRNDDDHWKHGVKEGIVHYAHIPNNVLEQWLRAGVNINDNKELFRLVNSPEWSHLKNTRKQHGSKGGSSKLIHLLKPGDSTKH